MEDKPTNNDIATPATPQVEQPVAQPVQTVQPAQPVQYIMMEKSLNGIGGWLIFFLICFGIAAVYGLIAFFVGLAALAEGSVNGPTVVTTIFTPLIAAASVLSIIYISMQKKLGKWFAIGTYALSAAYSTIMTITTSIVACNAVNSYYSSYSYSSSSSCGAGVVIAVIGGIFATLLVSALYSLYFFMSKRVKQTLVK